MAGMGRSHYFGFDFTILDRIALYYYIKSRASDDEQDFFFFFFFFRFEMYLFIAQYSPKGDVSLLTIKFNNTI